VHFTGKFVAALLLGTMFTLTGCELRRKPKVPVQATAPSSMPQPEGPKPVTPEPVQQPTVVDTTPLPQQTASETKPKPKPRRVARKVVPAEPAPTTTTPPPAQTPGGQKPAESQVQITAELPRSAAMRQNTGQLLDATENNLKKINRQLTDNEQATVRQIRTYILQAKAAVNDGDLERAYNLATKANLLSNELVK
jgi:outer membrane biosynthesis protein TonB